MSNSGRSQVPDAHFADHRRLGEIVEDVAQSRPVSLPGLLGCPDIDRAETVLGRPGGVQDQPGYGDFGAGFADKVIVLPARGDVVYNGKGGFTVVAGFHGATLPVRGLGPV